MVWNWGGGRAVQARLWMVSRGARQQLLGPVLGALLYAFAPLGAEAATITVNNTGTAVSGSDGACTLIEAITAANSNAPSGGAGGECAAGQPDGTATDVIVLQTNQTYTLSAIDNMQFGPSGLPLVTSKVSIQGNGASIQRAGGATPEFRLLHVYDGGDLTLSQLTVRNGHSGGSPSAFGGGVLVSNTSNLSATEVLFENNTSMMGGGLYVVHNSSATLTRTMFTGNTGMGAGGAIGMEGTVTLIESLLTGNDGSSQGGGVVSNGDLRVRRSLIYDNQAAGGGGIYSNLALEVTNSTISGNEAQQGGAITITGGTATVRYSTITRNTTGAGGGIYVIEDGTISLTSSIVAGNIVDPIAAIIADCDDTVGGLTSSGHNIVGQGTGCPSNGTGDQTIPAADVFETVLGPLASNGGTTQTHALLDYSPAINAGNDAVCTAAPVSSLDQRGTARTRCDIGAYEGGLANPPPGTPIDVGGPCTLIEAIEAANRDAPYRGCPAGNGADTIVLANDSTHTLTTAYETANDPGPNGLPTISTDITIEGHGATIQRVAADNVRFRLFFVNEAGALTLRNLQLTGGRTGDLLGVGGAIFARGATSRLTLRDVVLTNNRAAGEGGAIANGSLSIVQGGVGGTISMDNVLMIGNTAGAGGGGMATNGGTVTMTNGGGFLNNTAANNGSRGGGLLTEGTTVNLSGDQAIAGNEADSGGGLYVVSGNVSLTRGVLGPNNVARTGDGGGAAVRHAGAPTSRLDVHNSLVQSNRATNGRGGGLFSDVVLTVTNSTVSDNSAGTTGGGIATAAPASNIYVTTIDGSTVANNRAAGGGGGLASPGTSVSFWNTIVAGNAQAGNASAANADCIGPSTSHGYNLTGQGTGCPSNGTGDLTTPPTSVFTEVLGPLASNGQPAQWTHALLPVSPARDAGNPGTPLDGNDQRCSATDQRGTARPIDGDNSNGARCDIGAFEAPFAQVHTLTVDKRGGGTVTSSGGGIDCGTDCQQRYPAGTVVTLTATPDASSVFQGWFGGPCDGIANPTCQVTVNLTITVGAQFLRPGMALTNPSLHSTVTSNPPGISCGASAGSCATSFQPGTQVTLTATPGTGWRFGGWAGACTGTGTCQLTMDNQPVTKVVSVVWERINAGVQVGSGGIQPSGEKSLEASLTARAGCGASDQITRIDFGMVGTAFGNASVSIVSPAGGPQDQTTGFSYVPPAGTSTVTIRIRRVTPSGGATVSPVVLHDGCGEWRTLVGGGPLAF